MGDEEKAIVTTARGQMVVASGVDGLLGQIRAAWRAKSLIQRVQTLLPVDPSSACQRLFNAAVHDLREKIITAGLDIATEAAAAHGLPTVKKNEDVLDGYSPTNVLDLAYWMGLVGRPEWKRLKRAYDIRRDLEHEDDEYEAEIEDCVYIFRACIEIVLSKDPIQLPRVADVKDFVEAPAAVTLAPDLLRDYERAPDARQKEIMQFLVNLALDAGKPDIVRQNAVQALRSLDPFTRNTVKIGLAETFQDRTKRNPLTLVQAKVASAGGFLPYLKQRQTEAFFQEFLERLRRIGFDFRSHQQHSDVLDDLEDIGGLIASPAEPRRGIVLWLTLCFLGEPGGYGWYGRNRKMFYSDVAAPRITRMLKAAGPVIRDDLAFAKEDNRVKAALSDAHIARRYDFLLDVVDPSG